MKNLTITVDDQTYKQARQKAASLDTSVSKVVSEYLRLWIAGADVGIERLAALKSLFSLSDSRDQNKQGSAGPFSRAETYANRIR
jgi:hypothetical protein